MTDTLRRLVRPGPAVTGALIAGTLLFLLYARTAAPDLTPWDAPELVTALHGFGIPHPPGTPLWITISRLLRLLFDAHGPPRAATMASVVAGALAAAGTAWLVVRWTGAIAPGVAAAVASGTLATVWMNATETEVYALAHAWAVLLLVLGEVTRRASTPAAAARRALALGYVAALTPALHLSAAVVVPAALFLAAPGLGLAWRGADAPARRRVVAAGIGVVLLGLSALCILPIRAAAGPLLNEGKAVTWDAWVDVLLRRQYDVPGLWPRRAPLWLQLGNVALWGDWQWARGLGPTPLPTVGRTATSLGALVLAGVGGWGLAQRDRRAAATLALAALAGSVGVALWLNLLPGPSYGHGVVPVDAPHEARERDYFFMLGFWAWGVAATLGAWTVGAGGHPGRWSTRRAGLAAGALALVPVVANWRVSDRTTEPAASLPRIAALAMLEAAPPNGVLLLAGDLDGFPIWYLQLVEQRRLDVTPVIVPLLGASWYRRELAERARLPLSPASADDLAQRVAAGRRRVAASPLLVRAPRAPGRWRYDGRVLHWAAADAGGAVDWAAVRAAVAATPTGWLAPLPPGRDPALAVLADVVRCPVLLMAAGPASSPNGGARLLERVCGFP